MAVTGNLTITWSGATGRMQAWLGWCKRPEREELEIATTYALLSSFAIKGSRVMGQWARGFLEKQVCMPEC